MNPREQDIENALRSAPQPPAPNNLKNQLISQVQLPGRQAQSRNVVESAPSGSWIRRWWPIFAPAAVTVACAVAITAQQQEISALKQNLHTLTEEAVANQAAASTVQNRNGTGSANDATRYAQEIEHLKQQAAQLKGELGQLEKLRTENTQLRSQLARGSLPAELQEFGPALQEARENALRIRCINNLKQFGLAVRIWAADHNDMSPPNILSMSNELSSPKILICPADTNRPAAADWSTFTAANCSYEYLAPGDKEFELEPNRILSRCPIHGTVGLCDGSVQQVTPERASQFVQRDGKLYDGPPIDRQQSMLNHCVNNLRRIDGAKQQWALENRQTAQAIPTAQDIAPYLKVPLTCPGGGQYFLNAVGAAPVCSIPGHALLQTRSR